VNPSIPPTIEELGQQLINSRRRDEPVRERLLPEQIAVEKREREANRMGRFDYYAGRNTVYEHGAQNRTIEELKKEIEHQRKMNKTTDRTAEMSTARARLMAERMMPPIKGQMTTYY
jgi:hypothetical protein